MVSFTSIAQGIALVSILMMASEAAPAAAGSLNARATHTNATLEVKPVPLSALPPIIAHRVVPVADPKVTADPTSESKIIAKNRGIFVSNGGNLTHLQRRDITNVASTGLTYIVPADAPPANFLTSGTIIAASTSQIKDYNFLAAVAATTYCDSVVISQKWSCTYCQEYIPDGQVIVAFETSKYKIGGALVRSDDQKTIFVIFRGSGNLENWLANLEFVRGDYTPVSGASAHIGFYKAYQEASTYFLPQFLAQHQLYPDYQVILTGHSLGATQAVLGAMDLYQRISTLSGSNLSIYTVGCPRIGNDVFTYYVDGTNITHYRSVHNRDIVPHVPPQSLGYYHTGIEIWSKSATAGELCPGIENSKCSNSIVPFTSIKDHKSYYSVTTGGCV